jgi:hypothetical protein
MDERRKEGCHPLVVQLQSSKENCRRRESGKSGGSCKWFEIFHTATFACEDHTAGRIGQHSADDGGAFPAGSDRIKARISPASSGGQVRIHIPSLSRYNGSQLIRAQAVIISCLIGRESSRISMQTPEEEAIQMSEVATPPLVGSRRAWTEPGNSSIMFWIRQCRG